ncbi:MAG: epoxyqueuosine reductase QueH [Lachnospiraceae bacterium]|nr:epoxyqueuosine reductase QueH [Lachnospiraceae bacterium]
MRQVEKMAGIINYQKELEKTIKSFNGMKPSLLLHACCAPCSSYVLEYLADYFDITLFYYNPNITYKDEYEKRVQELKNLVKLMKLDIRIIEGKYEPERFFQMAKGLEKLAEGGERCFKCYELRLNEAAILARQMDFDYFTTTLSISPMKNAEKLNEIGERLAVQYGVKYLFSDFKKKNGYKRSIELSREYNLYRQDYCGCVYSKMQREEEKRLKMCNEAVQGATNRCKTDA